MIVYIWLKWECFLSTKGGVRTSLATGMLDYLKNEIILKLALKTKNEEKKDSLVHIETQNIILRIKHEF